MLLGFTDQDAVDRVFSAAKPFYRRVSSDLTSDQHVARRAALGQLRPAAWLQHGGLRIGRLSYEGSKAVVPAMTIGARRCLAPVTDDLGDQLMLAAVSTPALNGVDPKSFLIVEIDGAVVPVAEINWDNWLNPELDPRPMLRRSDLLIVPGHYG